MTSKAFRAVLPRLRDDELERLRAWSAANCAAAAVFREADCVIWLASKERARSREAFLRSVRGVLKRLAIDVSKLRGRWLVVAENGVVQAKAGKRWMAQPTPPEPIVPPTSQRGNVDDDDERLIVLSGRPRQPPARAVQVLKDV